MVSVDASSHDDKDLKKVEQPAPTSVLAEDSGILIGVSPLRDHLMPFHFS